MTAESHELALCLINENTGRFPYQERVELGKCWKTKTAAKAWAHIVTEYAHWYAEQYDEIAEAPIFSTIDILLAAADVAEYYRQHVQEIAAA